MKRLAYVCLISLFAAQGMAATTKGFTKKSRMLSFKSRVVKTFKRKKVTPTTKDLFGENGTFKGSVAIARPSRPVTE